MAIDRTPWTALIDDDGFNLVGTVWNKDKIKTVILDPVDAAFVTPTYGNWTPVDESGAGLAFASAFGKWVLQGRLVHIWGNLGYPGTSNGLQAKIGGLPYANLLGFTTGFYLTYGGGHTLHMPNAGASIVIMNPSSLALRLNSEMSGQSVVFAGSYLIS